MEGGNFAREVISHDLDFGGLNINFKALFNKGEDLESFRHLSSITTQKERSNG